MVPVPIESLDPSRHALLPNLKSFRGLTPAAREFSSLLTSSMPRDLRLWAPSLRVRRRNQSFSSWYDPYYYHNFLFMWFSVRWKWCCPICWGGFESTRTNKSSLSRSDMVPISFKPSRDHINELLMLITRGGSKRNNWSWRRQKTIYCTFLHYKVAK